MSGEGPGWILSQVRACHYLVPLTFELGEELGGFPNTPMLILRCPTHEEGSSHSF
jgi:hypothetical protein